MRTPLNVLHLYFPAFKNIFLSIYAPITPDERHAWFQLNAASPAARSTKQVHITKKFCQKHSKCVAFQHDTITFLGYMVAHLNICSFTKSQLTLCNPSSTCMCTKEWYLTTSQQSALLLKQSHVVQKYNFYEEDSREKWRDLTQSYDKSPWTDRKIKKKSTWQHETATKNVGYTTIADRLRTVSWGNDSQFVQKRSRITNLHIDT